MSFDLTAYWYRPSRHPLTYLLSPLAGLFGAVVALRRWMYAAGLLKTQRFAVPVIVVGNITVGGTGKTPFVCWLVTTLQAAGFRPGLVSRGVGGKRHSKPHWVQAHDEARDVGDEALLLQKTGCPVVIGINRAKAVQTLLQQADCNVVISDDGLQHYRLARDIEIVMMDGERRLGNRCLLPAGPLREPCSRLQQVDMIIVNGDAASHECGMTLQPSHLISLQTQHSLQLSDFPTKKIHAVAGIGHPQRFFNTLRQAGFDLIPHIFPDHHLFQAQELQFSDEHPIVMTEKDAVKCQAFADERHWYLQVNAKIDKQIEEKIIKMLNVMIKAS